MKLLLPPSGTSLNKKKLLPQSGARGTGGSPGPAGPTGLTGGVAQLVAGTNITLSPPTGLGTVTVNATGGGGGVSGSGTTGFIPIWSSSTVLGNSLLDYGITAAGTLSTSAVFMGTKGSWFTSTLGPQIVTQGFAPLGCLTSADLSTSFIQTFATATTSPSSFWSGAYFGTATDGTAPNTSVGLFGLNSNFNEIPFLLGFAQQIFIQPQSNSDYPADNGFVGIHNTSPVVQLDVIGAIKSTGRVKGLTTKTASYPTVATDEVIEINAAGATTVTLTNSVVITGQIYTVKNVGAGVCTVQASSGNIDSHASLALNQWQGMEFYWNGSAWRILSQSLAV